MLSKNKIRIIALEEPKSNFAEIYRSIRTNIEYSFIDKPMKVINFTSSLANEAKTTTVCNMAVMDANKYKRVLLIDLDLRNPSVHRAFGIRNKMGITDLLVDFVENGDNVEFEKYLNKVQSEYIINDLFVIPAGSDVVNPTEIIGSKKIRELIAMLSKHFDHILLDCSPSGVITDGVVASTIADGTVFIVESGKTKIDVAQKTLEQLKSVNANVIGTVLTKVPANTTDYGYYYSDHESDKNTNRIKINVE